MIPSLERVAPVLLVGGMLACAVCEPVAAAPAQTEHHALLDVPYVSQTPALCGGAAVAMVLRYWGARDVFAEDFAPLVGTTDDGILTGALVAAVLTRGWDAFVVPLADVGVGDEARDLVRSEIDRGRPLIALIEVAPRTFHYIVIVGVTDQNVVLHDPARAPYRVLPWTEFERAWSAAGRWTMLVLPRSGLPADAPISRTTHTPKAVIHPVRTACAALVDGALQHALAGNASAAEPGLLAATDLCPNDPAAWRELAGLRFSQSRWPEAQRLALVTVGLDAGDSYAWQLLATSRYLMRDSSGALDAWNHTDEPRLDGIETRGTERTRQPVVVRAAGLQPRQLLTSEALGRARRRLAALPAASNAQVRYEPVQAPGGDGRATVDLLIDERPVFPSDRLTLGVMAGRALLRDEFQIAIAGALGDGELVSAEWRWAAGRPRVGLSLAIPAPRGLPGILSLDSSWERQSFDATPGAGGTTLMREERRRVALRLAEWSTSGIHWQAGIALDRVGHDDQGDEARLGPRHYLAFESRIDVRLARDRVAVVGRAGVWAPLSGHGRPATAGVRVAWRSSADDAIPSWSAQTEFATASGSAPLMLWPGAGTGQARAGPLRAHPLLSGGVVTGPAFGRDVALGSLEYTRPVVDAFGARLSLAGFVDTARAWRRMADLASSPMYIDAGIGIRTHAPGLGGTVRIDLARGIRGGHTTLSAGWSGAWPN